MSFTPDDSEPEMILPEQVDPNQPDEKPENDQLVNPLSASLQTTKTYPKDNAFFTFFNSSAFLFFIGVPSESISISPQLDTLVLSAFTIADVLLDQSKL